jgi:hypothetical protein
MVTKDEVQIQPNIWDSHNGIPEDYSRSKGCYAMLAIKQ